MSRLINTELISGSDTDLDSEKVRSKFDTKLMIKLESCSDNDSEWIIIGYQWLQIKVVVTNDYK